MARPKKYIACLGFAANPPHLGHLWVARHLLKERGVDEVWLVPCNSHSFGKKLFPSHHRYNMAKLLEEPGIKVSNIELQRKGIRVTRLIP